MKKIFSFITLAILLTSAAGPASKLVQQSPAQNLGNENQNTRMDPYERYGMTQFQDSICKRKVGDRYEGGVLCAFAMMDHGSNLSRECHGFVCAPTDQPAASWADAAAECRALRIGGYSNWRLPTREELVWMFRLYKQGGGGLSWWSYWSDDDNVNNIANSSSAWYHYLGTDHPDYETKSAKHPVRAVRSF